MGLFGNRPRTNANEVLRFIMQGPVGVHNLRERQRQQQYMDRLRSDIAPLDGPEGSGTGRARTQDEVRDALMFAATNGIDTRGMAQVYDQLSPQEQFFNTRRGVVGVRSGGDPRTVFDVPDDPEPTQGSIPSGMRLTPDGGLEWMPGYVNAQGEVTGIRRDAVVARPTPSRARASGGGGASRPSGGASRLPRLPSVNPWDRDY